MVPLGQLAIEGGVTKGSLVWKREVLDGWLTEGMAALKLDGKLCACVFKEKNIVAIASFWKLYGYIYIYIIWFMLRMSLAEYGSNKAIQSKTYTHLLIPITWCELWKSNIPEWRSGH